MKLIIDIPEDSYERVMNPDKFYRDIDGEKIRWAVYKATPIPDNATNGDVIKAMFDVEEYHLKTEPDDVFLRFKGEERTIWFSLDFWNAPYQKGGK